METENDVMATLRSVRADIAGLKSEREDRDNSSNWQRFLQVVRGLMLVGLVIFTIYFCVELYVDWHGIPNRRGSGTGSKPSTEIKLEDVSEIQMPTAGMIPAPYATDARCFTPTPLNCTAYFREAEPTRKKQINCMNWLTAKTAAPRGGVETKIWMLDGVKATDVGGYVFTSILDYVEYSFEFPADCSEPYLWVFLTADSRVVTEGKLDPMKRYAQSSFLMQGGQYVMVAFNVAQDIDLKEEVTNTTSISVSSMMISDFNPTFKRISTAVFRPGSFRFTQRVQKPGQTVIEFIANLGGWVGMFLGLSAISVIDLVDLIYQHFQNKKKAKQQQVRATVVSMWVAQTKERRESDAPAQPLVAPSWGKLKKTYALADKPNAVDDTTITAVQ